MRYLAIAVVLGLAACAQEPAGFTPDVERNFMVACEAQGSSNALCGCVWDRIEVEISPGDFAALERLPGPQREAHPLSAQISGYVEACNVGLAPMPDADDLVPAP